MAIIVSEMPGQSRARATPYLILASIVASSGGLNFGYSIGISGGVTSMDHFQQSFPRFGKPKDGSFFNYESFKYCMEDNQVITAFTSSMYLAGFIACFAASFVTKIYGRRPSIILAGLSFLIGAVLTGAAQHLPMLILGRIMLGVGVGFGNQSVPIYLSEMASPKLRGALNIMFQLSITIGILSANLINYATERISKSQGWRISLGLAGVPAILMTVGGLVLPETPNSLIERGHYEQGRRLLTKIRGTQEVDSEYEVVKEASQRANSEERPFRKLLQRESRPQLIMAVVIPFFQQLTGINLVMFYAPVLFKTIGFGHDYSAVISGAVNLFATVISIAYIDRWGRRPFFLEGGVQMFLSLVAIAVTLARAFEIKTDAESQYVILVVVLICVYICAFAWSWGPLGWLLPSEIFPMETRSAGQAVNVSVNLLFTSAIAHTFLKMLCKFQYGVFLFFAGWVFVMTLFVYWFVPETKKVSIEEMSTVVWRRHWYWKRFFSDNSLPGPSTRLSKQQQRQLRKRRVFGKQVELT